MNFANFREIICRFSANFREIIYRFFADFREIICGKCRRGGYFRQKMPSGEVV